MKAVALLIVAGCTIGFYIPFYSLFFNPSSTPGVLAAEGIIKSIDMSRRVIRVETPQRAIAPSITSDVYFDSETAWVYITPFLKNSVIIGYHVATSSPTMAAPGMYIVTRSYVRNSSTYAGSIVLSQAL
ncbi:hypothetical protein EBR66_06255 [bacterium]|nr:hypothetical protein [bacterium]